MSRKQALILVGISSPPTHPNRHLATCKSILQELDYTVEIIYERTNESINPKHLAAYNVILCLGDGDQFLGTISQARRKGIKRLIIYIFPDIHPGTDRSPDTLCIWAGALINAGFERTLKQIVASQQHEWRKRYPCENTTDDDWDTL